MYYYNGKADEQYVYIATPERRLMGVLNGVDESTARVVKNAQNTYELSFTVYRYIDGTESAFYDSVEEMMTLYVDGVWYIINEPPSVINDGHVAEYKEVTAESAEIQLQGFDLKAFSIGMGTPESYDYQYYEKHKDDNDYAYADSWPVVKFYNPNDPELSLMHLILYHSGIIPITVTYDGNGDRNEDWVSNINKGLWKIGRIDPLPKTRESYDGSTDTYFLRNETYAFEIDNQDVYSFLTQDVSQAFQVIITFDTVNRTINATYVDNIGSDTNVYIGWRNIQNKLTGTKADQLYTTATVSGGDGIDNISYVNFGSSEIEDYSYFMDTKYVSQTLIDKYNAWYTYKESRRAEYAQLMKNLYTSLENIDDLTDRVPVDGVENNWSSMTEDQLQSAYDDYTSIISGLEALYVDENDNFDIDALKASSDWSQYSQIMNYILPSIVSAMQQVVTKVYTDLLYSVNRGDNEWKAVLLNLARTPTISSIGVYYYIKGDSTKYTITTDPSGALYYVYNSAENAIVIYGNGSPDRIYASYIEDNVFVDVTNEYGIGNLLTNPTFSSTNGWECTVPSVSMESIYSDSLPTYGTTRYLKVRCNASCGVLQRNIQVENGAYLFSAFIRSSTATSIKLGYIIGEYENANLTNINYQTISIPSTNSWVRISRTITVNTSNAQTLISVGFYSDDSPIFDICAPMLENKSTGIPSTFGYFQQSDDAIQSYQTDWGLYGTVELQNLVDNYYNQMSLLLAYAEPDGSSMYSDYTRLHQKYLDYAQLYDEATAALTERQAEVDTETAVRDGYKTSANAVALAVQRSNYANAFTDDDEEVLRNLYKHTDIQNENIVVTNILSSGDEIASQWQLWYEATDQLYASAHPQYTWEDTIDNVLGCEEFKNIVEPLELFSFVHVEVNDDNTYATLRLIGMEYNPLIYEGDCQLTFSTITQYKNRRDDFSQLIDNAVRTAKNSIQLGASSRNSTTSYTVTPELIKSLLANASFRQGISGIPSVANLDSVSANEIISKIINASEGNFDRLSAKVVDANVINTAILHADSATIDSLVSKLIEADSINAKYAEVNFANIDAANIDVAKVGTMMATIGMVTDLAVVDEHITGKLSAVEIDGDVINVNNIRANSLFLRGNDGLYYALNINALGDAAIASLGYYEVTPVPGDSPVDKGWYELDGEDYIQSSDLTVMNGKTYYGYWQDDLKNGLHGDNIIAGTITANKIYVSDLAAFNATIGGLIIDSDSIHTIGKNAVNSAAAGLYLDNEGQFNTGDAHNFIASWYDTTEGKWKVAIRADEISFGTGESVQDVVTGASNKVDELEERMDSGEFGNIQVSVLSSIGTQIVNGKGEGALYVKVYKNGHEIDPILSETFSTSDPANAHSGDYYYKIDPLTKSVILRKYTTEWVNATDTYEGTYVWTWRDSNGNQIKKVNGVRLPTTGKAIYIDASYFNDGITGKIIGDVDVSIS